MATTGRCSRGAIRTLLLSLAALAGFSLWLRTAFPAQAVGGSSFDDELFLKLARNLIAGRWLGDFGNDTLVKGPFYPLFIAAAFVGRVPLKLAEQALYLLMAGLAAGLIAAIAPFAPRRRAALGVAAFAALSLNPLMWWPELARVVREGIYGSLSLGVVVLAVLACFPHPAVTRRVGPIAVGLCLGLLGGAFWTTREEWLWLLPAVACIGAMAVARHLTRMWLARAGWSAVLPAPRWRIAAAWAAAAAMFCAVVGGVCALNDAQYGVFEVTEVNAAPFRHAYGALARIEPAQWQRFIVFPPDARVRAYAASPAARQLAPALDGEIGRYVAAQACAQLHIEPCEGTHAGWFQWALRDAVARAGHYASAGEAAAFYTALAQQIDDACADRSLSCLPPRATLAPPFRPHFVADTLGEAPRMLWVLLRVGGGKVGSRPSLGARDDIAADAEIVGAVAPANVPRTVLTGWVAAPAGPSIAVQPRRPLSFDATAKLFEAPDVAAIVPGQQAIRFVLDTDCPKAECDLVARDATSAQIVLPLQTLQQGGQQVGAALQCFVEAVQDRPSPPPPDRVQAVQLRIAAGIAACYAALVPLLAPLAAVFFGIAVATRRHGSWPAAAYALALASLVAVASRVLLLSYLHVTSMPAESVLYLSPAAPFVILFVVISLLLGGDGLVGFLRARSGQGAAGGRLNAPAGSGSGTS